MKIAWLLAFVTGMFAFVANAEGIGKGALFGTWEGGDGASEAIYGKLTLTKNGVSWSGGAACRGTYSIESKETSDRYPNMFGRPTQGRTFTLFKLRLDLRNCQENVGAFLFAFPSDDKGSYVEFVEFGKDGQVNGVMHFYKIGAPAGSGKE